jgi:hypothetical protein
VVDTVVPFDRGVARRGGQAAERAADPDFRVPARHVITCLGDVGAASPETQFDWIGGGYKRVAG